MTSRRAGFTLVEVVVVLIVLAVISGLAVPAFRQASIDDDMTIATKQMELIFSTARDSAIRTARPMTVTFDSATRNIWLLDSAIDSTSASIVPEPLDFELPRTVSLHLTKRRVQFRFSSSGAVFGDSILLRSSGADRVLRLNPWSGAVVYE